MVEIVQDEFDDGGHLFELDYAKEVKGSLEDMRYERLLKQKGRYIITCFMHNKKLYLQDRNISNKGYWTQFKSNARVFDTEDKAEFVLKQLKYNKPTIEKG